jgi:hypothetical protein
MIGTGMAISDTYQQRSSPAGREDHMEEHKQGDVQGVLDSEDQRRELLFCNINRTHTTEKKAK